MTTRREPNRMSDADLVAEREVTPLGWPVHPRLVDGHADLDDPFFHADAILERLRRSKQRARDERPVTP